MQTGDNDGRVNPMQSRKMTARLQAATAFEPSDPARDTTSEAGHGIGSPLSVTVGQIADYTGVPVRSTGDAMAAAIADGGDGAPASTHAAAP